MRNITKKFMISILTSIMVLITMVATTYAWVGIFTYSSTDKFNMNLKVFDLDQEYFLTISNSGEASTFSPDAIPSIDVKKEILLNMGAKSGTFDIETGTEEQINYLFDYYGNLEPLTCVIDSNNVLSDFKAVDYHNSQRFTMYETKDYFKMDVYLSVDTKEGIQANTEVNSNIFIADIESALKGIVGQFRFKNGNPFNDLPSNSMSDVLKTLPDLTHYNVNSANAARFALSIYEPIDINDSYKTTDTPLKTLIYQGGSYTPIYDPIKDVYDLGGNLPEDYNTALKDLLVIRPNYSGSTVSSYVKYYNECLSKAVERGKGDLELIEKNSLVWGAPDALSTDTPYLGIYQGVQTKIKIEIYFWFEGWDADCLSGIDDCPVEFNLAFTAHNKDYTF